MLAEELVRKLESLPPTEKVERRDVKPGDTLHVTTRNSQYTIRRLEGEPEMFAVSGGWFDKNGWTKPVGIHGCTWGGSMIAFNVLAAVGMRLEFGNDVTTTEIQAVRLERIQ